MHRKTPAGRPHDERLSPDGGPVRTLACLLAVGAWACSSEGTSGGAQSLEECILGVWVLDGPCNCSVEPALAQSPECEASDCTRGSVLVIEHDALYQFWAKWSDARRTASADYGCNLPHRREGWRIEAPDTVVRLQEEREVVTEDVRCTGDTLLFGGVDLRDRADPPLATALGQMPHGDDCTEVPYGSM